MILKVTHAALRHFRPTLFFIIALIITACGANVQQIIPTQRPTVTATFTVTPSRTPDENATPTHTPTRVPVTVTGGPSPTAIFGATSTPADAQVAVVPTDPLNPNAPRIEFFTSDQVAVAPGSTVTLFWSARGANDASIYRLDAFGERNQVWNVAPDGSLTVRTSRDDRGSVDFVLSVNNGPLTSEVTLSIPLSCPNQWFFTPGPDACPDGPPETLNIIEEPFERGRMIYLENTNNVYALFNDGNDPAWAVFPNRYDPDIHPELETSFVPPPGLEQPLRILGFVWRGNDVVRNRLGLGTSPELTFEGFVQVATAPDGSQTLYISSADGSVLQLLQRGSAWQIITPS